MRKNSTKLIFLAVLAIICILLYGFYDIKGGFDYEKSPQNILGLQRYYLFAYGYPAADGAYNLSWADACIRYW